MGGLNWKEIEGLKGVSAGCYPEWTRVERWLDRCDLEGSFTMPFGRSCFVLGGFDHVGRLVVKRSKLSGTNSSILAR